jgi:metal-dependent amidase/aminoacylase/carboxypeptidase family protein
MKEYLILAAVIAAALNAGPLHAQQSAFDSAYAKVTEQLTLKEAELIALRRDLHQHPELSGQEERTSGVIAQRLQSLGFEVRKGVGGFGVVGVLHGAEPGPTIAFRADMDAVRSTAPDPVEFRSLTPGVRHICGHDVHVTVGLAIAEGIAAVRDDIAGSVMLVFQPAEENATGARAMLADDVFGSAKPDAIYAVHTAPFPVGQLGTKPGGMMAGRDVVQVSISGSGDLDVAADSVRTLISGVSTLSLQDAVQSAPDDFVLAQVFPGHGASGSNRRTVRAQITTANPDVRLHAKATILGRLESLQLAGVTVEPDYLDRVMAGVTNDSLLVSRANTSIGAVLGDEAVILMEGVPPAFSEDFGSFQDEVPGVMYFLGVSNPTAGTVGMPHSPDYVADEGAILVGAKAMMAVFLDWLLER